MLFAFYSGILKSLKEDVRKDSVLLVRGIVQFGSMATYIIVMKIQLKPKTSTSTMVRRSL